MYSFKAILVQNKGMDAAYVEVPMDIRKEFGKGRLKVEATFDGVPYSGSIVNMGVKDAEGNICYILGVTKAIRKQIGKTFGEEIEVTFCPV
ncbi:MAG: DUF1905 domain-containing protein [Bacteroidales bacterium]|nr:DUF1905 domain-containing protein [Bacteroidales bacterium]